MQKRFRNREAAVRAVTNSEPLRFSDTKQEPGVEVSMKELRQLIRDLREDHDLKQREVASYLGISQQTYSNYENGVREIPTNTVVALAKFYQVSTDYLLNSGSGYLGNTNLDSAYLEDTTLHDVMYDIQNLDEDARKELLRFIQFLGHSG